MFLDEGQRSIIEQVGRHQHILAVIEFSESYLAVGIEEATLVTESFRDALRQE
jgi:hypothetical protein